MTTNECIRRVGCDGWMDGMVPECLMCVCGKHKLTSLFVLLYGKYILKMYDGCPLVVDPRGRCDDDVTSVVSEPAAFAGLW